MYVRELYKLIDTKSEFIVHAHGHRYTETWFGAKFSYKILMIQLNHGQDEVLAEFPYEIAYSVLTTCYECGQHLGMRLNEDLSVDITSEHPHEDVGEFDVTIPVPSGKLLLKDCLQVPPFLDPPAGNEYYTNYTIGIKNTSIYHAQRGMMHFYVGNTCPAITRQGNTIRIGDYHSNTTKVGGVCTDLWWVSAIDLELFRAQVLAHSKDTPENTTEELDQLIDRAEVVSVAPGHYRCTSYYHFRGSEKKLYARMRKL